MGSGGAGGQLKKLWTQDAFVCLFAVFKTKSAWHWEFHLKELPSEISYSKACKWHCHVLVYKGVVFILDLLNCFISKITSLLFTSTIQIKAVYRRAVVHLMRPFFCIVCALFRRLVYSVFIKTHTGCFFKIQCDVGEVLLTAILLAEKMETHYNKLAENTSWTASSVLHKR